MLRQEIGRFWQQWVVRVSAVQVLVTGALIYGFDAFYDALHTSQFWAGPVDWVAHIGTALLILNLLPWGWRRAILLPALLGSFLIDLDHTPQFFHLYFLTEGTPRPYTHSLTSPIVCCLLAVLVGLRWPRARLFMLGFGFGVILHFVRDMAEGSGEGIPLLWPLTKHAYSYPHWLYLIVTAATIAANLVRLSLEGSLVSAASARPQPS